MAFEGLTHRADEVVVRRIVVLVAAARGVEQLAVELAGGSRRTARAGRSGRRGRTRWLAGSWSWSTLIMTKRSDRSHQRRVGEGGPQRLAPRTPRRVDDQHDRPPEARGLAEALLQAAPGDAVAEAVGRGGGGARGPAGAAARRRGRRRGRCVNGGRRVAAAAGEERAGCRDGRCEGEREDQTGRGHGRQPYHARSARSRADASSGPACVDAAATEPACAPHAGRLPAPREPCCHAPTPGCRPRSATSSRIAMNCSRPWPPTAASFACSRSAPRGARLVRRPGRRGQPAWRPRRRFRDKVRGLLGRVFAGEADVRGRTQMRHAGRPTARAATRLHRARDGETRGSRCSARSRAVHGQIGGLLATATSVGLIAVDIAGRIVRFNRGAERIYGLAADGRARPPLRHPAERPRRDVAGHPARAVG